MRVFIALFALLALALADDQPAPVTALQVATSLAAVDAAALAGALNVYDYVVFGAAAQVDLVVTIPITESPPAEADKSDFEDELEVALAALFPDIDDYRYAAEYNFADGTVVITVEPDLSVPDIVDALMAITSSFKITGGGSYIDFNAPTADGNVVTFTIDESGLNVKKRVLQDYVEADVDDLVVAFLNWITNANIPHDRFDVLPSQDAFVVTVLDAVEPVEPVEPTPGDDTPFSLIANVNITLLTEKLNAKLSLAEITAQVGTPQLADPVATFPVTTDSTSVPGDGEIALFEGFFSSSLADASGVNATQFTVNFTIDTDSGETAFVVTVKPEDGGEDGEAPKPNWPSDPVPAAPSNDTSLGDLARLIKDVIVGINSGLFEYDAPLRADPIITENGTITFALDKMPKAQYLTQFQDDLKTIINMLTGIPLDRLTVVVTASTKRQAAAGTAVITIAPPAGPEPGSASALSAALLAVVAALLIQ